MPLRFGKEKNISRVGVHKHESGPTGIPGFTTCNPHSRSHNWQESSLYKISAATAMNGMRCGSSMGLGSNACAVVLLA